jgi:hypothetical protein
MASDDRTWKLEEIARLKSQAGRAYDSMYDLYEDAEIRWQYELAYESLISVVRLAEELGLTEEAAAAEERAQHIRKVYRHQFMRPPDRS